MCDQPIEVKFCINYKGCWLNSHLDCNNLIFNVALTFFIQLCSIQMKCLNKSPQSSIKCPPIVFKLSKAVRLFNTPLLWLDFKYVNCSRSCSPKIIGVNFNVLIKHCVGLITANRALNTSRRRINGSFAPLQFEYICLSVKKKLQLSKLLYVLITYTLKPDKRIVHFN